MKSLNLKSAFSLYFMTLACSVSQVAYADSNLPGCLTLDHSQPIAVGTKCLTSMGFTYERVSKPNFGEAWQGPSGVTWSNTIASRSTHDEAVNMCKNVGGELPSQADFEVGQANNFLEVLSFKYGYASDGEKLEGTMADFWTATSAPLFSYLVFEASADCPNNVNNGEFCPNPTLGGGFREDAFIGLPSELNVVCISRNN